MKNINVKIKASYRGHTFNLNEWDNSWSVVIGEEQRAYSNTDIKKVKAYVDKFLKNKFTPIKALGKVGFNNIITEIKITSLDSENKDEAWVINQKGDRLKECLDNLFALTEDNLKKIEQMKQIEKETELLEEKKRSIYESLTPAIEKS